MYWSCEGERFLVNWEKRYSAMRWNVIKVAIEPSGTVRQEEVKVWVFVFLQDDGCKNAVVLLKQEKK